MLATGCNTEKTNPLQKQYNKVRGYNQDVKNNGACHAECNVLQKTKFLDIDWNKATIYIYREHGQTHQPLLAKPCVACQKALKDRGIEKIYYSTPDICYAKL